MKVDPRALAGIERKITRADEHFAALDHEMRAWIKDGPNRGWALLPEVHDEGRKHVYRVFFGREIPIDWAVSLGEAVHDLRSALDQSVYWLTVDWKGKPLNGTSFPVYRRKREFKASGMYKIRGVGPGPHAFIQALQPYAQRYRLRVCMSMRTLHDIWNQDKHRLVHLWGLRFTDENVAVIPPEAAPDCTIWADRRMRHDGAKVFTIICDPPHPEMQMMGEITSTLAIDAGKGRTGNVPLQLGDIASDSAGVVRKLVGAIGQQDTPIPV